MKNVIILHGATSDPGQFWLPWLAANLREKDYKVWVPSLPQAEKPDQKIQVPFVLTNWKMDRETILIGHSAGCPLILDLLEEINVKIKKAVLVAGYVDPGGERPKLILKEKYNWRQIKDHCASFVFINSINDPWGCNDKQGRKMFDYLGGTLIINEEGHMGSRKMNQPYKRFPLLLDLVLV